MLLATWLIFLLSSFYFGLALSKFFLDKKLKIEHFIFAFPLGVFFLANLIFFSSFVIGFSLLNIWLNISFALFLSFLIRPKITFNLKKLKNFKKNYLLASPLLILSLYFIKIWSKMYFFENGDFYASFIHAWGDIPIHLSYTYSFLFGENFPPKLPLLSNYPASYHFMADFFSAILLKLNANLITILILPGCLLSINLIFLVFLLAKKITKNNLASILAVLLFFFCGGMGFVYWQKTSSFIEYTQLNDLGIYFANIIPALLIPQKASLFGLVISIIIFIILWNNLERINYRSIFFASLLTSFLPLTYIHGFFVSMLFLFFTYLYLAFKTRRKNSLRYQQFLKLTLYFWLPIILFALIQLVYFYPSVAKRASAFLFGIFGGLKGQMKTCLSFILKTLAYSFLFFYSAYLKLIKNSFFFIFLPYFSLFWQISFFFNPLLLRI